IQASYPEAHRRWREDSVVHRPPGGETVAALQERALAATAALLERHAGETLLVVAHGGPIRVLLCGLLELPLHTGRRFGVDNAGITTLLAGERGCVLAGFNHTSHL